MMSLHTGDSSTRSLRLSLVTITPFVFCARSSMNLTNNHPLFNENCILCVSCFGLRLSCCTQKYSELNLRISVFEWQVKCPSIWITQFNINKLNAFYTWLCWFEIKWLITGHRTSWFSCPRPLWMECIWGNPDRRVHSWTAVLQKTQSHVMTHRLLSQHAEIAKHEVSITLNLWVVLLSPLRDEHCDFTMASRPEVLYGQSDASTGVKKTQAVTAEDKGQIHKSTCTGQRKNQSHTAQSLPRHSPNALHKTSSAAH